ncbi:hypothetical protein [Herbaspirillum huttiense]|uniref:hypothetical protein n=1 Tax=Herbaspirillum huttiense TaxID=863372 RepID=UPI0039AF8F9E
MGQAKIKQRAAFAAHSIEEWEAEDCVNFAVALARLTGWLLHVDWWSTSTVRREDIPLDQLTALRVYVADNHDRIFDVRGVKNIIEFNEGILSKIVRKRGFGNGGVYTRYYDETKLSSLPLRSQPNEALIARATREIKANPHYLAAIPPRIEPYIPAYNAAQYTFGNCAAYAEAMHELTGLKPAALLAVKFTPLFEGTQRNEVGYFHSVVLHPDGMAEDSWGKASVAEIANRFGVIEFTVSTEEHPRVIEKIRESSADIYAEILQEARNVIHAFRVRSLT